MLTFVQPVTTPYLPGYSYTSSYATAGVSGTFSGGGADGLTEFRSGHSRSTSRSYSSYAGTDSGSGRSYWTRCQTSSSLDFNGVTESGTIAASTYTSYTTTDMTDTKTSFHTTSDTTSSRSIYTGTNTGTNSAPTITTTSQTYSTHHTTYASFTFTRLTLSSGTFTDPGNSYMPQTVIVPETNVFDNDWLLVCIPNTNISEWINETWQTSDVFFSTDDSVSIDPITGASVEVIGAVPYSDSGVPTYTFTFPVTSSRHVTEVTFEISTADSTFYDEGFLPMEAFTYTATYNTASTATSNTRVSVIGTTSTSVTTSFSESILSTDSAAFELYSTKTVLSLGSTLTTIERDELWTWMVSGGGISSSLLTLSYPEITGYGSVATSAEVFVLGPGEAAGKTVTRTMAISTGWNYFSDFTMISAFYPAFTGPVYMIQPEVSGTDSIFPGVSAEITMAYPGGFTTVFTGTATTLTGSTTATTTTFGVSTSNGLFLSACAGESTDINADWMGVRIPFQTIYPAARIRPSTRYSSFIDGGASTTTTGAATSTITGGETWRVEWSDSAALSVTLEDSITGSTSFTNSLSPIGDPVQPQILGRGNGPVFFPIDTVVSTILPAFVDRDFTIGGRPHAGPTLTAVLSGNFSYTNTDGTGTTEYFDYFGARAQTTTLDTEGAAISVFRKLFSIGFSVSATTLFPTAAIVWLFQKHEQWTTNLIQPVFFSVYST